MAMSNAERQKKFRANMKKKGRVRKDSWTDRAGLLAPPSATGGWITMTLKELEREFGKLLKDYNDEEKEIVYAEIFEHAKQVEKRFKPVFEHLRKEMAEAAKSLPGNS